MPLPFLLRQVSWRLNFDWVLRLMTKSQRREAGRTAARKKNGKDAGRECGYPSGCFPTHGGALTVLITSDPFAFPIQGSYNQFALVGMMHLFSFSLSCQMCTALLGSSHLSLAFRVSPGFYSTAHSLQALSCLGLCHILSLSTVELIMFVFDLPSLWGRMQKWTGINMCEKCLKQGRTGASIQSV